MTVTYKLQKDEKGKDLQVVKKTENNNSCFIPFDEANTDYQAYLEWKAIDGNEPEAAD
tara:strand:+ start:138 stop:311 length:174 start_codon:yes stop_codon:yes gene_type:complete